MNGWALDLGTTNSGVACWDDVSGQPRLVELPAVCRRPEGDDPLQAPRLVPSVVEVLPASGLADRLGAWPPIARRVFLGRTAWIGRPALERNLATPGPGFVPVFKQQLGRDALRVLAQAGGRPRTAREVAASFLRELLAEVKRATGDRIRDLVVTVPVDSYETYRAEVSTIARRLGVRRLRFLDEPLAAALGYGLGLSGRQNVLVLDFGGGTLPLALVGLAARETSGGHAHVLAKQARPIGGRDVDGWILADVAAELGFPLAAGEDWEAKLWHRLMLAEAGRVKEAVFTAESALFRLTPPASLRHVPGSGERFVELTREDLGALLARHGLYTTLEECLELVAEEARRHGADLDEVDEVVLVGGSTLLPGIYPLFEERFGRDRVRAWRPFEAVAYGAVAFATDHFSRSDFIVHDYAVLTHDAASKEPRHEVVVPRGTRFPTAPDHWKRQLVPTCALGEPETMFKLVICEIGQDGGGERRFAWDGGGALHSLGGAGRPPAAPVVVPLNADHPTLGHLDPPHPPGDRRARLEVAFGVDEERWLRATVRDLRAGRLLMDGEPVVRLL